ncbi:Similar to Acyl-CoA Delta(11) desaturase (Spodoptera littoralis) [Cotesia congregata]|uniref:Similar to Acyl-CoA Delta(11) desaturase (Spodoptera littoralis) n=1 Tax=Cotesia congregata TaxID=51543 RepID=A0A8J2HQM6_COTCN|nr:Similar to Acyl-CoA Delta(11) desaturase (Spodoptera littoralis) [Cotesia congregata]
MAGQTHMSKWIRDHRTHHRYSETHADPHNSHRGFFFSHVGWLMMRRHPAVKKYGSKIDMSDIKNDPVIQFFDKYYTPIMLFSAFVLPTIIPVYCWNESWSISFRAVIIRYVWLLNATFAVNSFAHMFGNRPYNKTAKPTENSTVAFFTLGEGWHSYHHTFPWDYKAAELGAYGLNATTGFIDIMSWFGLAYDLKKVNKELVERISRSKGDGTDSYWGNKHTHH